MTEPYEAHEPYEPTVADYGHAVLELHAEHPSDPSTCRCGIPVVLCLYRSLARQLGIPVLRTESGVNAL